MKVVLIDAFDSFVWIIAQYVEELGATTVVLRSHPENVRRVTELAPDALLLGPGPGTPSQSGHVDLVHAFAGRLPILGVCLGHQAIAEAYGAIVRPAQRLMHGKSSQVEHDGRGVFAGVPPRPTVARYHSLVVDERSVPPALEVSARSTDDGYVMGLRHRSLPVESVQFHPESIATTGGNVYLRNFLGSVGGGSAGNLGDGSLGGSVGGSVDSAVVVL